MRNDRDGRRTLVLQTVRAAVAPLGVADLAERLGVHQNTIRFHLDALERQGRVRRTNEIASRPGRPRVLYESVREEEPQARNYELLADILLQTLGDGDRAEEVAARAGYAWGRRHAERSPGDPADALARLVGYLDDVGFVPRRIDAEELELHNCPFREIVSERGELPCTVHAGLMRGALEGWNAGEIAVTLEPFARPGVCRARLAGLAA